MERAEGRRVAMFEGRGRGPEHSGLWRHRVKFHIIYECQGKLHRKLMVEMGFLKDLKDVYFTRKRNGNKPIFIILKYIS